MDEIRKQLSASNGINVAIMDTNLSDIIEDVFDELMKYKDTLQTLHLIMCYLRYIPNSIGNLNQLTSFSCQNNQLKLLPDSISNLSKLRQFSCSRNQLEFLPDWIGDLNQLKNFWCYQNQIEYLPISMRFLENLEYFQYDIDKIQNLDEDIYQKSASEIIKWMQKNYSPMVKSSMKN